MALDLTRLPSRICSTVNSPPQTLHRHPGGAACAIPGAGWCSGRLAGTSSQLQCGHCRRIIKCQVVNGLLITLYQL